MRHYTLPKLAEIRRQVKQIFPANFLVVIVIGMQLLAIYEVQKFCQWHFVE